MSQAQPLTAPQASPPGERPTNRVLVLFGASGDLAARRLYPGFYRLFCEGMMPEDFRIIGSGRDSPGSDREFRPQLRDTLQEQGRCVIDERWEPFAERLSFVVSSAEDGSDLASAVQEAEQ